MKNGELRLSIEGSQLIGKAAKKNVVEISDCQVKKWLFGNDIEIGTACEGFVIVRNKNDFLGTGKIKDGVLLNFIPKTRRIHTGD